MRINPIIYGVLVLAAFFGIILGFQAVGIWSISGKVSATGDQVQPSGNDINTIKGWMTLEQIATTFNMPLAELLKQFELPADTAPTTAIKDLESDSFDTTSLRIWLQSRSQLVNTTPAPTTDPKQPVAPTPATLFMENLTPTTLITSAPTEHVTPEKTITGKTTFKELLDWGVPKDAVQKVIGADLPALSMVIKDYVTGKGLEFTTIKTQLQAEVDKVK